MHRHTFHRMVCIMGLDLGPRLCIFLAQACLPLPARQGEFLHLGEKVVQEVQLKIVAASPGECEPVLADVREM